MSFVLFAVRARALRSARVWVPLLAISSFALRDATAIAASCDVDLARRPRSIVEHDANPSHGLAHCLVFHEVDEVSDGALDQRPVADRVAHERVATSPSTGREPDVPRKDLSDALRAIGEMQRTFRARWGLRLAQALEDANDAITSNADLDLDAAAKPLSTVIAGADSDLRMVDAIMGELLAIALDHLDRKDPQFEVISIWGRDLSDAEFLSGDPEVVRQLERAAAADPRRADLWRSLLSQARENGAKGKSLVDTLHDLSERVRATGDTARALRIRLVEVALRGRAPRPPESR